SLEDGLAFLAECRRGLTPDGGLRLSTPDPDWGMATHYRRPPAPDEDARTDCIRLNRAFHGWGHQFLYNRAMLESAVRSAGFARAKLFRYGDSDAEERKGLERHETWEDTPDLPHVLIVEASGRAKPESLPAGLLQEFREALASK